MVIRTGTVEDLDAVAAVEAECFPPAEAATRDEFAERLRIYGNHCLLVFDGDKLIAFIDGFVTASLTVSIGAMAILGAIQDGILGDPTTLYTKAVLDLIIIMVMAGAMGKGCIFSAVPVGILQGSVTLLARLISPLMTDAALANISLVGSIMIFCVGVNLVWGKTVRVANLLPSLIVAVAIAFLPM